VVMTCGKDLVTGNIYVLDYFRARCSPGEHSAALFDHVNRWNPIEVGYEDVAYQRSLDYWLKELMRQQGKYFLLSPVKRGGRRSKEAHIMGLQPIAAAGSIYIRPHMRELLSEFLSFPRGAHDDLIDAMAMQTPMWRRTKSRYETQQKADLNDPYSLDGAIENIRQNGRRRTAERSIVFDPFERSSTLHLVG